MGCEARHDDVMPQPDGLRFRSALLGVEKRHALKYPAQGQLLISVLITHFTLSPSGTLEAIESGAIATDSPRQLELHAPRGKFRNILIKMNNYYNDLALFTHIL